MAPAGHDDGDGDLRAGCTHHAAATIHATDDDDDPANVSHRRNNPLRPHIRYSSTSGGASFQSSQSEQSRSRSSSTSAGHHGTAMATASPKPGLVPLFALVALVSLSWSLYQLPLNRVVERRLCVEYYRKNDPSVLEGRYDGMPPEEMCKVDEVQKGLGRIQGVMETGWVVGDFVMTIPLVAIADQYGHGRVLLLNLVPRLVLLGWTFGVGYFDQVLPVNAIMAAPWFSVLGGDCVFSSIVYSLVSSSTDDTVQRASLFGQVNAITAIFTYQLGPALASASMTLLLWLPLWFGILLLLVATRVISVMQSDPLLGTSVQAQKRLKDDQAAGHQESAPLLLSQPTSSSTQPHPSNAAEIVKFVHARFNAIVKMIQAYPLNFSLLLTSFFLTSLASSDTKLLTQYISKRYEWKFTSVGYLLSVKAVFNFFLLFFLIPAVLRRRRRRGQGPRSRSPSDQERQQPHYQSGNHDDDQTTIRYAHICLVFSVLGAVAIGMASTIWLLVPSLLLYALGIALPMFTYSLLKSSAMRPPVVSRNGEERLGEEVSDHGPNPHDSAGTSLRQPASASASASASEVQLFSIVMLVKTSGALVGAPLMAGLWVHGVGVGGAALGLPYYVSAACYGLVIWIFFRIRV